MLSEKIGTRVFISFDLIEHWRSSGDVDTSGELENLKKHQSLGLSFSTVFHPHIATSDINIDSSRLFPV